MIKLTKKAIQLLDAVTSVPYFWMPSYLSPATPTSSPATLTREEN
jgi:hypothetical protein